MFLALRPMIKTMIQWKPLIAFGDTALVVSYCLNFQQRLERDENPRPKLISPVDITGKQKYIIEFMESNASSDYLL